MDINLTEAIYCTEKLVEALRAHKIEQDNIYNVGRRWNGNKTLDEVVTWSRKVRETCP